MGFGALALITVALLTSLAGFGTFMVFGALALTTALVSLALPRPMALLIGVTAWAIGNGFALNQFGELTFNAVALQWLVVLLVLPLALGGIVNLDESEGAR